MEISNALKLARRAKENNDSENAKKYYELIPSREANALKFFLYYLEWQKLQE